MNKIALNELAMLLVEPSDTQQKIIVNQLKAQGLKEVVTANSLAEALEIINSHPRDLIASAMYYPDGTAMDLLTKVRASEQPDTPFMLVTSECKKQQLEQFKQSGVIALLPKPFSTEHLSSALETTVDLLSADEMELDYFDVHDIRVLLVDDSRLARNHIRRVLNNLGLEKITEAIDGQQAIELINEDMFDLVVTDFNMPEVDGRELTRYIREHSQQSHIPILMVTSESNEAHLANIEQDGVNALCDKPFEPKFVKQLLYKLLNE